jgi:hypothetical protein
MKGNDMDALKKEVEAKRELVEKVRAQMGQDPNWSNPLNAERNLNMAKHSLDASELHMEKDPGHAVYLYGRACWNLGEFFGKKNSACGDEVEAETDDA